MTIRSTIVCCDGKSKENLTLHLNRTYLDHFSTDELISSENINSFLPPRNLTVQLSHEDIKPGLLCGAGIPACAGMLPDLHLKRVFNTLVR